MIVFWVAVLVTVLDQWTKEVVRARFHLDEMRPVVEGFFSLVYVRNTGAAFGVLNGRNLILAVLSVAMIAFLLLARRSFLGRSVAHRVAYGLLIGGILGNLLDRVRLGYVVDFLHFYAGRYQWPSFNIADAAICTGFALYFLRSWLDERAARKATAGAPSPVAPARHD